MSGDKPIAFDTESSAFLESYTAPYSCYTSTFWRNRLPWKEAVWTIYHLRKSHFFPLIRWELTIK